MAITSSSGECSAPSSEHHGHVVRRNSTIRRGRVRNGAGQSETVQNAKPPWQQPAALGRIRSLGHRPGILPTGTVGLQWRDAPYRVLTRMPAEQFVGRTEQTPCLPELRSQSATRSVVKLS